MSVASPSRAAFPGSQAGRHPRLHFRGLLRLHSNYGPLDRSTAQGGLCHRASIHPVTRTNRLPATRSNRQLSGWFLPPLVIRAFWAHRDRSVSTAPSRARGRPASAAPPGSRSPASPARPGERRPPGPAVSPGHDPGQPARPSPCCGDTPRPQSPRLRREQVEQEIFREQKYSVPSSATRWWPSRRRKGNYIW